MSESICVIDDLSHSHFIGRRTNDSVTDFLKHHPGGATVIAANAGRDVTYVILIFTPAIDIARSRRVGPKRDGRADG
jgi:hypothetical protein